MVAAASEPQLDPLAGVVVDSGAAPQPDGSVTAAAAVVVAAAPLSHDEVASAGASAAAGSSVVAATSRFRYAVISLPVGTTATTSQPSPDFSVSIAASDEAS